ncbi:MAG: type II secretion system GspH family protein [Magnetococcus sp. DMHC-8]
MNRRRPDQGFSLLELIVWMVVVSLAAAGLIPLFGQVFSSLHWATEGMQGHWLAQAVVEQMNAQDAELGGFEQIRAGECLKPDGLTPWAGDLPLTCQITLRGAEPRWAANIMECTPHAYADGDYKCVTVTLRQRLSGEPVAQVTALFARSASH